MVIILQIIYIAVIINNLRLMWNHKYDMRTLSVGILATGFMIYMGLFTINWNNII